MQQQAIQEDESETESNAANHVMEKDAEKSHEDHIPTVELPDAQDGRDQEAQPEAEPQHRNVIAGEDYSVFTESQKRSIIVAGSFLAWFSPVSTFRYHNPSLIS